jgi:hypothetical protein
VGQPGFPPNPSKHTKEGIDGVEYYKKIIQKDKGAMAQIMPWQIDKTGMSESHGYFHQVFRKKYVTIMPDSSVYCSEFSPTTRDE